MTKPCLNHYKPSNETPEGEFEPDTSHGIMVRMVGHGKNVLEVGCASGYMSRQLAARGNRVTGIDIDAEALEEARVHCEEAFNVDLDVRPLAEFLQGKQYDVAVFGDVLEHLRDPLKLLRDTRSFLSPGGSVVISIPNVAHGSVRLSLLQGAFDYTPLGLLDNTHLRFFTLRTVRELCLRAGYRIEAIERTKVPLFLETELVPRVSERDFNRDVIDEIRRDPEHDTLQFVVRAVPVWNFERIGLAPDALADVEMKFADAAVKIDGLERQLQELNGDLARAGALAEDLRQRLATVETELAAVQKEACYTRDALVTRLAKTEEAFKRHLETDIAMIRAQALEIDGMIRDIQGSWAWSLKMLLLRARRHLPGARARV